MNLTWARWRLQPEVDAARFSGRRDQANRRRSITSAVVLFTFALTSVCAQAGQPATTQADDAAASAAAASTAFVATPRRFVARLTIDAPIGPATAEYYRDTSKRAIADGARAIVLQLDTPGGLAKSMHAIIADILASPVPVLGYVAPSGARAASAGTYILYACHIAAMAPATHLGAATPVALAGHTPMPSLAPGAEHGAGDHAPSAAKSAHGAGENRSDEGGAEAHKVLNDAIAYIRSLAQLRHRNAEWAEKAVRRAATLTAAEAVRKHVVDFVAPDLASLLAQADGRTVEIDHAKVKLVLAGLPVRDYAPDWRTQFLSIITNPTIAYALLLIGIWGLVLEGLHPGVFLPGIVGGISLLVGLYALQLLPVNYAGLALMALGIALVLGEVMMPSVGALGIGGVAAFTLGSVMLFDTSIPGYGVNLGVIAAIAVFSSGLLALVVWMILRSRRRRPTTGAEEMVGARGEMLEAVSAHGEAWARVHGERWRVHSHVPLAAGTRVRVVARDGLILSIDPDQEIP